MNFFGSCYLTYSNQLYGKFPPVYFATFSKGLWTHAVLGTNYHFQSSAGLQYPALFFFQKGFEFY